MITGLSFLSFRVSLTTLTTLPTLVAVAPCISPILPLRCISPILPLRAFTQRSLSSLLWASRCLLFHLPPDVVCMAGGRVHRAPAPTYPTRSPS
jgi:hypothetical protein